MKKFMGQDSLDSSLKLGYDFTIGLVTNSSLKNQEETMEEGGALEQEYALPGAVILPLPTRTPLCWNGDSINPLFKPTGRRERLW